MNPKALINDLLSLFFPETCPACGDVLYKYEKQICLSCQAKLPRTNFHLLPDNLLEQSFWGRFNLKKGTSFLFFSKDSRIQRLIHSFKYKSNKEIGFYLGRMFVLELKSSDWFSEIDLMIPVPLHPEKQKRRGYNQSEIFAKGMASVLNISIDTQSLQRIKASETQTRKSRFDRWENVNSIFKIADTSYLENKNILLIDDVITTGATIEACAQELLKVKGTSISIASLAFAAI